MNNCPCCPNHCEKDNLGCHRGQEYFERGESGEDRRTSFAEDTSVEGQIMSLLRKCGHMLHHGRDLSPEDILSELSQSEREELLTLLTKVAKSEN